MDASRIIQTLSERTPWRKVGSPILKFAGLETHRGWDLSASAATGSKIDAHTRDLLAQALVEHLVAGEKLVQLFPATTSLRKAIRSARVRGNSTAATDAFPLSLPKKTRTHALSKTPELAQVTRVQNGYAMVFASLRVLQERVPITGGLLEAIRSNDSTVQEAFGVRRHPWHAYDSIWVPDDDELPIATCIDSPKGARPGDLQNAAEHLHGELRKMMRGTLKPLNLFPAIDSAYRHAGGRVVELAFVTDGGKSVKLERMREGSGCLRSDQYHAGGSKAVSGHIDPYRIAVEWKRLFAKRQDADLHSKPEVAIYGTSRMLHVSNPQVDAFFLRNAINAEDLAFAVSKLSKLVEEPD